MRSVVKGLAVIGLTFALIGGAQDAFARGGGHMGGGGWGGGGHWGGGGGHWGGGWGGGWRGGYGGWGYGGWGYPYWGYGWASPYLYDSQYDYGYDYPPPPPQPEGGLYCVTKAHLCGLDSARAPGARCSCGGARGRVSVLQGQ